MATSSQAAPATTAAVSGGGTTSTTSETVAGFHVFRVDNFSGTRDLGAGKSVRSSTFRVGGHAWYIKCYPCGVNEDSNCWVSLYLCRHDDHHGSRILAECKFTLMESLTGDDLETTIRHADWISQRGTARFIERQAMECLLKEKKHDCFRVRCTVSVWIDEFPPVPLPQRGHLAGDTVAGSHVLAIEEYSKTRQVLALGDTIESCSFRVGGHLWYIQLYPCGEDENKADGVTAVLCHDDECANEKEVMVRFQMSLLTHAEQIIASIQTFHTFTDTKDTYGCYFLGVTEHEPLPLLQDTLLVRCDMAIVNGITAMPNLLHRGIVGDDLQLQGGNQQVRVRTDVTFEVGGRLFPAHRCVLATRCTAFMAKFFSASGKDSTGATDDHHARIDDIDPRVFEAFVHFIYTDTLPEISEEDKVVMAQGLLVAADQYAMERLKLICSDMLCSYINEARTAVTTLDLADKHGCRRLKEVCMKFLMDQFANVIAP